MINLPGSHPAGKGPSSAPLQVTRLEAGQRQETTDSKTSEKQPWLGLRDGAWDPGWESSELLASLTNPVQCLLSQVFTGFSKSAWRTRKLPVQGTVNLV